MKKKEELTTIKLHTTFQFALWENVINTAMALSQSGYFVNIIKGSGVFILNVYKRN